LDIWTSKNNISILAIILHWIDNDWQYHEQAVEFGEIIGSHTGINIGRQFLDCLEELDLKKKVYYII
jgi:hypothetical protein